AGASLLGRWADEVSVGEIVVSDGDGSVVRGVTASRLVIDGARSMLVDQSRVAAPTQWGIDIRPGSSVRLVQVEVADAESSSIVAIEPASIELDRVFVHHGAGPGVWIQGADACDGN